MERLQSFLQLTVLVITLLSTRQCLGATEICNDRLDYSTYSTPTTGSALSGSLYLDKNNPFNCYGIVTQWRFCYKRSPGIISDTLKIGLYQLEGNSYVRKGANYITLQLQNSECLTVDANPQLVVQSGYVVAFIATSIYIKFYDDPNYGHMYKTVAFPTSFLSGVLIKTTNPYAPKLQGYVENLETTTTTTTTTVVTTTSTATGTTGTVTVTTSTSSSEPSMVQTSSSTSIPISSTTIPAVTSTLPPTILMSPSLPYTIVPSYTTPTYVMDISPTPSVNVPLPSPSLLDANECLLGVKYANTITHYNTSALPMINIYEPCTCGGEVRVWEICYSSSYEESSEIYIGVWRSDSGSGEGSFTVVGVDTLVIDRTTASEDTFTCTTISGTLQGVAVGDYIGVISPNVPIAYSMITFQRQTKQGTEEQVSVPLVRAIIEDTQRVNSTSVTSTNTDTPTDRSSSISGRTVIAFIISGSIVGIMIFIFFVIIGLLVLITRRKYFGRTHPLLDSGGRNTVNVNNEVHTDMEYNLNYIPSTLDKNNSNMSTLVKIKENPSYSAASLGAPPSLTDSSADHVYEALTTP